MGIQRVDEDLNFFGAKALLRVDRNRLFGLEAFLVELLADVEQQRRIRLVEDRALFLVGLGTCVLDIFHKDAIRGRNLGPVGCQF